MAWWTWQRARPISSAVSPYIRSAPVLVRVERPVQMPVRLCQQLVRVRLSMRVAAPARHVERLEQQGAGVGVQALGVVAAEQLRAAHEQRRDVDQPQ